MFNLFDKSLFALNLRTQFDELRSELLPRGSVPVNRVNAHGTTVNSVLGSDGSNAAWVTPTEKIPIGTVLEYYGTTLPTGYLWCDGSAIPASYTAAIAAIGANTPDKRGRVGVGRDNLGGTDAGRLSVANTLGASGGEESHLLTAAESGLPSHTSLVDIGGTRASWNKTATGGTDVRVNVTGTYGATFTGGYEVEVSTAAAAAAATHNNMQPYILCNFIIRVI